MLKLPYNAQKMLENDHSTVKIDNGYSFPVYIQKRITEKSLVISCTPNIAGLILTNPNGIIHSITNELSLALFGYQQAEILGSRISIIIPNFKDCSDKLGVEGYDEKSSRAAIETCVLDGIHKDMGVLQLSIQGRKIKLEEQNYYAIWVLYQKTGNESSVEGQMNNLSLGHRTTSLLGLSDINITGLPPAKKRVSFVASQKEAKPQSPPKFPSILLQDSITLKQEDFEIIDSLGEGSFSFIKLCVYKDDPNKVIMKPHKIDTSRY